MTTTELLSNGLLMAVGWWVLFLVVVLFRFLERKALADIEARIGPKRVGWSGLLQPIADWTKVLMKSAKVFPVRDSGIILLASAILFSSLCSLPLGGKFPLLVSSLNSWIPLILFFFTIQLFSLVDLKTGEIVSVLGAARRLILFFGFFLPAMLSILHVYLLTGGASWQEILEHQRGFFNWHIFSGPLGMFSAVIFIISGIALSSVHPFSMVRPAPRSLETGLFADFISFFFFFLWSTMAIGLFFGGPGSLGDWLPTTPFSFWLVIKVLLLMMVIRMLGSSFSRLHMDQAIRLAWGFLVPLSSIILMFEALWTLKRGLG